MLSGNGALVCVCVCVQVYVIQMTDGAHRWTVKHRYSDFHVLHEKVPEYTLYPLHIIINIHLLCSIVNE